MMSETLRRKHCRIDHESALSWFTRCGMTGVRVRQQLFLSSLALRAGTE